MRILANEPCAPKRGIRFEEIVDCILNPDKISTESDSKVYYKKLLNTSFLLCYTTDKKGDIVVITVIKTSKISKYFA